MLNLDEVNSRLQRLEEIANIAYYDLRTEFNTSCSRTSVTKASTGYNALGNLLKIETGYHNLELINRQDSGLYDRWLMQHALGSIAAQYLNKEQQATYDEPNAALLPLIDNPRSSYREIMTLAVDFTAANMPYKILEAVAYARDRYPLKLVVMYVPKA